MFFVLKSGRFAPEWVAAFRRNRWQVYSGITGRFGPEYAIIDIIKAMMIFVRLLCTFFINGF